MKTKKIITLLCSLFITALGIALMNQAQLGLNPWWTFITGVSHKTGISTGLMVQIVGGAFLVTAYFLGSKPGIGTILDIVLVGTYISLIERFNILIMPDNILLQLLLFVVGLMVFSLGIFITLTTGLGVGPKEQFTIGVMVKTKKNIQQTKFVVEGTLLLIGFLLGAPLGVGTILCTVLTGIFLNQLFKWFKFNPSKQYS